MINFALVSQQDDAKWGKIRRTGMAVTTAVLVVYIVVVVGVISWGWYWSRRQTSVSQKYAQLSSRVIGLSEQEVVVRKLANRLDAIKNFLDGRGSVTALADTTIGDGVTVVGWSVDETGVVKVKVKAPGIAPVKAFVDLMATEFSAVQVDSLVWTPLDNWVGTVSLKELKG